MIRIHPSPSADSRTMKTDTSMEEVSQSTYSHISDVQQGMRFLADQMIQRSAQHDHTKIEHMQEFYDALQSGKVIESDWYQKHITTERHHLMRHVPEDVNLIDVIEHLVDCTMAGLARSGTVFDTVIGTDVLMKACWNTVQMLINNTEVVKEESS